MNIVRHPDLFEHGRDLPAVRCAPRIQLNHDVSLQPVDHLAARAVVPEALAVLSSASSFSGAKKTSARTSILSRGAASGGLVGSLNAVCAVNRARPSSLES